MFKMTSILGLAVGIWFVGFSNAFEKGKDIPCDDKRPQVVRVVPGRITVLNFPFKPKDVVPGSAAFDFKQIKNDLVIMAVKPGAHTNAVVYLEERRCTFDLTTVKANGDDILIVKDPKDSQYEVKFHE
jgi:hypothetical protein